MESNLLKNVRCPVKQQCFQEGCFLSSWLFLCFRALCKLEVIAFPTFQYDVNNMCAML